MNLILFNGISPQDFKEELLKDLKKELQELQDLKPKESTSELLTRQQTADLLSIDLSTLYHWTKKGKLPAYGISGRVYYKRNEVEQAIIKLN